MPSSLVAALESEARTWTPYETGGMLLGYHDGESPSRRRLVITDTIPAGPRAERRKRRFVPDGEWQQTRLTDTYKRSHRITTYLGDWHSHPFGHPRPSWVDRKTFARVAASEDSGTRFPLMLILTLGRPREPGAFVVSRTGRCYGLEMECYEPSG